MKLIYFNDILYSITYIYYSIVKSLESINAQALSRSLLTSICSIFFFMFERSYERTYVSFFSDLCADVMNFTAASFSFEIKSMGQLPLCFISILGINILSSVSVKKGCRRASAAVILSSGSFWSIFRNKSASFAFSRSKSGPVKTKSHYLFRVMISCPVLAIKRCRLKMM